MTKMGPRSSWQGADFLRKGRTRKRQRAADEIRHHIRRRSRRRPTQFIVSARQDGSAMMTGSPGRGADRQHARAASTNAEVDL